MRWCALAIAMMTAAPAAHGQDIRRRCAEENRTGSERMKSGDYTGARVHFLAAYELCADPVLLYNIAHTYVAPAVLVAVTSLGEPQVGLALIWVAHIGFDRLLGYGLKYHDGFGHTHLGLIGKARTGAESPNLRSSPEL